MIYALLPMGMRDVTGCSRRKVSALLLFVLTLGFLTLMSGFIRLPIFQFQVHCVNQRIRPGDESTERHLKETSKTYLPEGEKNGNQKIPTNRVSIDDVILRYPWLQKHNFMSNFYTKNREGGKLYSDRNTSVVFVHYPKAEGRTMKECLDTIADLRSYPVPTRMNMRNRNRIYEVISPQKFYVSEFTFGICDILQQPCSYFTILRDPYERLISCYEYCRSGIHDPICTVGDINTSSLKDWVLIHGSHFFRQLLYNFREVCLETSLRDELVSSVGNRTHTGSLPCWYLNKVLLDRFTDDENEILLEYILDNLENWFSVIGITAEHNMTLKLLEKVYNLPFYEKCSDIHIVTTKRYAAGEKKTQTTDAKETVNIDRKTELMQDIEVQNALRYDIRIYEKATEIFKKEEKEYIRLFST
ncbi:uncharacterized protein LOC144453161 [Glandiceps talaboti]